MNLILNQDEVQDRISKCLQCDSSLEYHSVGLVCGRLGIPSIDTCGCIIKLKAKLAKAQCPQDKWINIDD